jgi:hypothetical protein
MAEICAEEVKDLHRWLVRWFRGEFPNKDTELTKFKTRFHPRYVYLPCFAVPFLPRIGFERYFLLYPSPSLLLITHSTSCLLAPPLPPCNFKYITPTLSLITSCLLPSPLHPCRFKYITPNGDMHTLAAFIQMLADGYGARLQTVFSRGREGGRGARLHTSLPRLLPQ